jgi:hypothetical protein
MLKKIQSIIKYLLTISDKTFDIKWRLIFVLTFISCVISYFFFNQRELMSEYLIVNTIYLNNINGFQDWFGIYFYDGQPYISQMGIHGVLFSLPLFLGVNVSNLYIWILIFAVTLSFYYIIVSIAIEIKLQISSLSAFFFLLVIILNPILLLNSGNLYWLYFMYLLPFYFALKYYGKLKNRKFYFYLSLIFLIKFLVNFEYSSTVVISCLIPIALKSDYRFLIGIKRLFRDVLCVFCSSVVSFAVVILLLLVQISLTGEKSFTVFQKVVRSYTAGSKNEPHFLNYENRIVEWNILYKAVYNSKKEVKLSNNGWDNVIKARNSYKDYKSLLNYINFNNKLATYYSLQFILFMFISVLLFVYFLIRFKIEHSHFYSLLFSFIASLSWVLLMPMHFYLHSIYWRGISDIVLIFPLYTSILILIGYVLNNEHLKFNVYNSSKANDPNF